MTMTNTSFIHATPDATACRCDNCDWTGPASGLDDISDVQERLDPGGVVPAGQCPACGALAYAQPTATETAAITRAKEQWASDDINIDPDAKVSVADDGAWVQAWVWVAP